MYDARKNGQLLKCEGRIPDAQIKINNEMVKEFDDINKSYREKVPKIERHQVESMARKGRNLLLTRRNHWLPLSTCAQPIVLEREQYDLYDDVLSVCKPKLIYTVIAPEDMTLEEMAVSLGPITDIKTYELKAGETPIIPPKNYTLDISKDFAPAYIRTSVLNTIPYIANKDASHDYVRAQVVSNDQSDMLGIRADYMVQEKQLPETYSLAQDFEADSRIECHAQILRMSTKNKIPSEDAIRSAKILAKNIKKRDIFVKEIEAADTTD